MLAQQHHFFNITSETDIKQGYEVYIFKTRLTKCKENDLSPKLADAKKKGHVVLAVNVSSTPALHLSVQEVTSNASCGSSF